MKSERMKQYPWLCLNLCLQRLKDHLVSALLHLWLLHTEGIARPGTSEGTGGRKGQLVNELVGGKPAFNSTSCLWPVSINFSIRRLSCVGTTIVI